MGEAKNKRHEHSDAPYLDKVAPNVAAFRSALKKIEIVIRSGKPIVEYESMANFLVERLAHTETGVYDLGNISEDEVISSPLEDELADGLHNLLAYAPSNYFVLCCNLINSYLPTPDSIALYVYRHEREEWVASVFVLHGRSCHLLETIAFFSPQSSNNFVLAVAYEPNRAPDREESLLTYSACRALAAFLAGLRDRPRVIRETHFVTPGGKALTKWVELEKPPVMTVRVLDLQSPIVVQAGSRDESSKGDGMPKRPHNGRAHTRTLRSAYFRHKQGQTIYVSARRVHGGVDEPTITVVNGIQPKEGAAAAAGNSDAAIPPDSPPHSPGR